MQYMYNYTVVNFHVALILLSTGQLGTHFVLGWCVYPTKSISGVFNLSTAADYCTIALQV